LLPGDPGRALLLAQELTDEPQMSNHHRGLWGYYGEAVSGPLTIQATGVGGPSAAIVFEELVELGVRRAIRVGTCGALDPDLRLGDFVVARDAFPDDGTSRALGSGELVTASEGLTAALAECADGARLGRIATTDLFYEPEPGPRRGWVEAGCVAVEMEAATLFTLGERLGAEVGCILIVTDVGPADARERLAEEDLAARSREMGRAAVQALAGPQPRAQL
jgi:uridine phosphorylase